MNIESTQYYVLTHTESQQKRLQAHPGSMKKVMFKKIIKVTHVE